MFVDLKTNFFISCISALLLLSNCLVTKNSSSGITKVEKGLLIFFVDNLFFFPRENFTPDNFFDPDFQELEGYKLTGLSVKINLAEIDKEMKDITPLDYMCDVDWEKTLQNGYEPIKMRMAFSKVKYEVSPPSNKMEELVSRDTFSFCLEMLKEDRYIKLNYNNTNVFVNSISILK